MTGEVDQTWVRELIARNQYLVLSTTDGTAPWIAPVQYLADDDLNLYFFSPEGVRHVRHLEANAAVAVVIFDRDQPQYSSDTFVNLNGIQMEGTAGVLAEDDYTDVIVETIDALKLPMPPYAVFKIEPHRFYVPSLQNGVDVRYEVDMR